MSWKKDELDYQHFCPVCGNDWDQDGFCHSCASFRFKIGDFVKYNPKHKTTRCDFYRVQRLITSKRDGKMWLKLSLKAQPVLAVNCERADEEAKQFFRLFELRHKIMFSGDAIRDDNWICENLRRIKNEERLKDMLAYVRQSISIGQNMDWIRFNLTHDIIGIIEHHGDKTFQPSTYGYAKGYPPTEYAAGGLPGSQPSVAIPEVGK